MAREIPEGSVEIQTGLWLYQYDKVIAGENTTIRLLYSSEEYCFYNKNEEPRVYAQFAALAPADNLDDYVSIPIDDDIYIVSNPDRPVEM